MTARVEVNQAAVAAFLRQHGQALLKPTAEKVRARQKRLCPRDTASNQHMADNIEIAYVEVAGKPAAHIGPAARFFYGRFVEIGTVHMRPKPFIRPSIGGRL